jgi:hypothetical protein
MLSSGNVILLTDKVVVQRFGSITYSHFESPLYVSLNLERKNGKIGKWTQ